MISLLILQLLHRATAREAAASELLLHTNLLALHFARGHSVRGTRSKRQLRYRSFFGRIDSRKNVNARIL